METVYSFLPSTATAAAIVVALVVLRRLQERGEARAKGHQFRNQVIMVLLTGLGALIVILIVPISDTVRGQVLGLVGVLLSAAIALSSTTVLGNAMAGFMMRTVRNFRLGDFIRVGEQFGRVSERGLFHTEIQNEDRELTTIPNLYLVTHPVTTIRASGTIISTQLSLGYDVPRTRVDELLLAAAEAAELTEPFVQVTHLGDFSVTYRVAGLLTEVKRLISTRSTLRKRVLDSLHEGGIEIVSPTFMNTRAFDADARIIPRRPAVIPSDETASSPEAVVFDKADEAESLENLRESCIRLADEIKEQEQHVKDAEDDSAREKAERKLKRLRIRQERLEAAVLERQEAEPDN